MQLISWEELTTTMRKFNIDNGYTAKGNDKRISGVVVFEKDSFSRPYTEKQRSYEFTSDNKAFLPGQIGNSIFADCIDGSDDGVRIDIYIHDEKAPWKVEKCYLTHNTK